GGSGLLSLGLFQCLLMLSGSLAAFSLSSPFRSLSRAFLGTLARTEYTSHCDLLYDYPKVTGQPTHPTATRTTTTTTTGLFLLFVVVFSGYHIRDVLVFPAMQPYVPAPLRRT